MKLIGFLSALIGLVLMGSASADEFPSMVGAWLEHGKEQAKLWFSAMPATMVTLQIGRFRD